MKLQRSHWMAIASALFSFLLALGYLKGKEHYLNSFQEPVSVVIAKKEITPGTLLDERVLELFQIPKRFVQPQAVQSVESAVGQIAAVPILEGEQIVGTKLLGLGSKGGLAIRIPAGLRALTLEVDEVSGVAGLVRPNQFVDLIATFDSESSGTETIAQRILVLAIGQDVGALPAPIEKSEKSETLFQSKKNTVTLALTPAQVQEVEFAKQKGKISLALRPQWEEDVVEMRGYGGRR